MVAAGVKRAVGTSDDAVTRGGVLALPMWPFAGSTVSPEACYNINKRSKRKNYCVVPMNINLYYAETAMHVAQESKETDPSITVTDDCIIANTPVCRRHVYKWYISLNYILTHFILTAS